MNVWIAKIAILAQAVQISMLFVVLNVFSKLFPAEKQANTRVKLKDFAFA